MKTHKDLILQALGNMKGDDTARARLAFRGFTPQEMKKEHGISGKTRAEILSECEAHDARVDAAAAWIISL